jgi:hypothetical protein
MTAHQIKQLSQQAQQLSSQEQKEVLNFVAFLKTRSRLQGTPGHTLRPLKGTLSDDEAQQMLKDIDEGCGQIDWEGWK